MVRPISVKKLFDSSLSFESQIYNDDGVKWEEINALKP